MKRFLLTAWFLVICLVGLSAQIRQNVPFNGLIKDSEGNPIKRVRVFVDKYSYAKSDRKGRFGLTNVRETDTLRLVYHKQNFYIPVGAKKSMVIKISDQVKGEEKIDVEEDTTLASYGFDYVRRREFVRVKNSSSIPGEVIARTNATDLLDALQGLVPGLSFFSENGKKKVLIRGRNTLNLTTDPLFLVDGVQVSDFKGVNLYDIASVEVLKDGAMYGSRGANGVIHVHTIGPNVPVL